VASWNSQAGCASFDGTREPEPRLAELSQLARHARRRAFAPFSRFKVGAALRTRTGEVVSSGMNKTIVVRTVTRVPHPKFGKIVKQMKKFYAHDEQNQAKTGDRVRIMETRPISKLKRWRLVEVIQK